mgnify:CR=1 FL=1
MKGININRSSVYLQKIKNVKRKGDRAVLSYEKKFSKIKNELGWAPNYSFEEGMRKTVDWYIKNSTWCENVTSGKYQRERLGI